MDGREKLFFFPLIVLTLVLGVLPFLILEIYSNSVGLLVSNFVEKQFSNRGINIYKDHSLLSLQEKGELFEAVE